MVGAAALDGLQIGAASWFVLAGLRLGRSLSLDRPCSPGWLRPMRSISVGSSLGHDGT